MKQFPTALTTESRMRTLQLAVAAVLIAILVGCNAPRQTGPVVDPTGPSPQGAAGAASLPAGSGCGAAIARYRSVIENDLKMGHVNQSVYSQIQGEIGEAETACATGQDSRAVSLVRASKSRHGYPG
jgi:hypothetical protein